MLDKARFGLVIFAVAAALSSCGKDGGSVEALSAQDRLFLFSNVDRGVAFLGQPAEGVALSCDATAMQQGYVFRYSAASKRASLDSLRPSGVESHSVDSILVTETGYEIAARNGANIKFKLTIDQEPSGTIQISWDRAEPAEYLRCSMAT